MKNNYSEITNIFADMTDSSVHTVCKVLCDKKMTSDLSGEFTLPDYLPEMRRVIRINVIPTAPSKFISGGAVQLGGGVDYTICYAGADGKLYGTTFSNEYSFNAPFDPDAEYDAIDGIIAAADVTADSVTGRVIGARKLGIKARLSAKILAIGSDAAHSSEWMNEPQHSNTQKLVKTAETCRHLIGSNDEVVIHDTIDQSARYVSADCGVFLDEVRSGDGYVDCRGTVKVRYLLCGENDGMPYVSEKRYAISETVELDGMRSGAPCTAYCTCTGIDVANSPDGGDSECAIHLRILAQGFVNEKISYVSDAYSTVYDTACETKTMHLPILSCCALRNMTFDASVPFDKLNISGSPSDVSVISVTANAVAGELEFTENGDKASAIGTVVFNILYSSAADDGSDRVASAEIELPFRVEGCEAKGSGKMMLSGTSVFDPRAKVGAGEIDLGCEITLSCSAVADISVENVTDVNIFGEIASKRGGISICFPADDDSLWSVAKKYRVSSEAVKQGNGISGELADDDIKVLEKVKYLIV